MMLGNEGINMKRRFGAMVLAGVLLFTTLEVPQTVFAENMSIQGGV